MNKHFRNSQNKKFAISLQYLVKEVKDEVDIYNCLRKFQWSTISLYHPKPHPISTIFWKRGLKKFFWRVELDRKGVIHNWRKGSRVLETGITKFTLHNNATPSLLYEISNLLKL